MYKDIFDVVIDFLDVIDGFLYYFISFVSEG